MVGESIVDLQLESVENVELVIRNLRVKEPIGNTNADTKVQIDS